MTQKTAKLETVLPALSTTAMEAFCEDLDGMLGIALSCRQSDCAAGPLKQIQPAFQKLAVVYTIQNQGALDGRFALLLDRVGLFLLSGLIVMLPEDKIKEQCRRGTLKEALNLMDSLREIGNLCVGSWDRIYREQFTGHEHLLQTDTQIINPWERDEPVPGISPDETCLYVLWELTIPEYPPFTCAAVFPASLCGLESAERCRPESRSEPPAEIPAEPAPKAAPAESQTEPETQPATSQNSPADPESKTDRQPPAESDKPSETAGAESPDHPVSDAIQELLRSQKPAETDQEQTVPQGILSDSGGLLNHPARMVMDRNVFWLNPNDSVEIALRQMQQRNTRYALVEEEQRLVGILSRGDLNGAVSPYLKPVFNLYRRPLDDASLQIRIKWFMSRPVHTIRPEAPLWKVMETLYRYEIRALPVQDAEGNILGLITVMDIFHHLLRPPKTKDGSDTQTVPKKDLPQTAQPEESR